MLGFISTKLFELHRKYQCAKLERSQRRANQAWLEEQHNSRLSQRGYN